MVDREAIAAYDRRVTAPEPCALPIAPARLGLLRSGRAVTPVRREERFDETTDVAVMGAGPWGTLAAAALAHRGHRVLLLERSPVLGFASTWNVSRPELEDLKAEPTLSPDQWESLVKGEFTEGVFRLYDAGETPPGQRRFRFDEILNLSLDEVRFLDLLLKTPGLTARAGRTARVGRVTPTAVYLRVTGPAGATVVKARLCIDATGWRSRLAAAVHPDRRTDAVYNMLGVRLSEKLPRWPSSSPGRPLGLICATFENEVPAGGWTVQPILERFTDYVEGRVDGGDVVYFFTRTPRPAPLGPLVDVMLPRLPAILPGFEERFVDRTYFGHGPTYLPGGPGRLQTGAGDRLLLLGSAAVQYSGLTLCAFGPLARNARDLCDALDRVLRRDRLSFRDLNAIDIDPRERISQSVENLFAGITELDSSERPGTVNRDWIAFAGAADGMDQSLKCEAFRDKLRLRTMHQLLRVCARRADVIEAMVRNNRGRVGLLVWTLLAAYVRLLWMEVRLVFLRRDRKYLYAGGEGLIRAPVYAGRLAWFTVGSLGAARRQAAAGRRKP